MTIWMTDLSTEIIELSYCSSENAENVVLVSWVEEDNDADDVEEQEKAAEVGVVWCIVTEQQ